MYTSALAGRTQSGQEATREGPGAEAPARVPGRSSLAGRLPPAVQQQMERSFGADFSEVQVHVDAEAAEHGALAFARGNELHFAPGQYDPDSASGLELIGHELTHVVQQRQGRVSAPQHKGGVNADAGLELEADAAGARAARGMEAGLSFIGALSGAAMGGAAPIQRKTAVGIVKGVASSNLTRELILSLVTQHKLEVFLETLERSVLWWADVRSEGLPQLLAEAALGETITGAVTTFAGWINPYLGVLQTLRSIYRKLPDVVQQVISFGLGSGMARFLGLMVSVETAEAMVNAVFVDNNLATGIDWAYQQLFDIAHTPMSWIYKTVWDRIAKRVLGTKAATPAAYAVEQAIGPAQDAPSPESTVQDPALREASPAGPLLKKDLRYLWLEIDQPSLARFDHKGRKSGGLDLPFKFGVNIFDAKMESREPQHIHLPWSGGFGVELSSIAIDAPTRFPPVFSVGTVTLTKVRVNETGLDFFAFQVEDVMLADNIVTLPSILGSWSKTAGLRFGGVLQLQVFGTRLDGRGAMSLDPSGGFEEANLTLTALDQFTIIPGILALQNPGFTGKVAKGGKIDLSLFSDIRSTFSIFDLDARHAHLDYHKGKGHELAGGIDHLTVRIGKHVRLDADQLTLDRHGLRVAEAKLVYEHDPEHADRAKDELSTIKGISPDLLSFTGLKSLTIGGKVLGLRIGAAPGVISVDGAQTPVPTPTEDRGEPSRSPGARGPASSGGRDRPDARFHVDAVEPVLSKIGAKAFGVAAELDLENKRGTVDGEISYEPALPSLDFEVHFLPGLAAFVSLAPGVKLGASVHGHVGMPRADAFELGGTVGANAQLKVTATAGAQVGSQLVAALRAGIFAEGSLTVAADAGILGTFVLDRQARRLRASDKPSERPRIKYAADAAVKASVGVVVSGHAFLFFKKDLWGYTFKEWEFGKYHVEGEVHSAADGAPELATPRGQFVEGHPNQPAIAQEKLEDARRYLREKGLEIQGSAEERRKILEEIVTRYKGVDEPMARRLDAAALQCAELKREFVQRRLTMATQGVLQATDFEELDQWRANVERREQELALAKGNYREVQLVLVNASTAAELALEKGDIDITDLEDRIRRAAETREADTRQAEAAVAEAREIARKRAQ
jgi:uncharacterized protein DUF4157